MTTADEYRKRAQECVELAQKSNAADRAKYLQIAEAWLTLADDGAVQVPSDPAPDPSKPSQRRRMG